MQIPNFSLKTDNFNFLGQICSKRVFLVKNRKSEHHHWILHIRISLNTKLQLGQNILIFRTKLAQKRFFPSKTEKVNNTIRFLHIRISLGPKFQLKPSILIFWIKSPQKGYFRTKTEKLHFCMRPWLLLTLSNFYARGPTDTTIF